MLKKLFQLPLVLVFTFLLFMLINNKTGLLWFDAIPFNQWIALLILLIAILIVLSAAYSFKQVQTTVDPRTPEKTSSLVIRGIYRFSRNPMYLGFLLVLFAGFIYSNNLINAVFPIVFIFLSNRWYIQPEEKILQQLFGQNYQDYRQNVRRWI